ncbi:hypothetical protein H2200_011370 [Cladophialophora chaetospira]|uniref:F-box domain-containing protein n=1 Tax=Cladophialophora chaetospira TaxID=386627 RepID=A0AA38WZ79_9EURO|nr:hypothetical protein H2200_011370 [Cladophialophora chaetospira]
MDGHDRQPTDEIRAMAMNNILPVPRRTINDFPAELLESVLTDVKRSSDSSSAHDSNFTHCLLTCSFWRDVGVRVLWTDVHITNISLAAFCASGSTAFGIIRTLTFTIGARDLDISAALSHFIDAGGILRYGSGFAMGLAKFPEVIKQMSRLESFSLAMDPTELLRPGFWSINKPIRNIIDALPRSLHHLEIDTRCYYDTKFDDPSGHLCPAIARLLPTLSNLRLNVGWLCNDLFHGHHTSAPNFETPGRLVINTIGSGTRFGGEWRNWPATAHCASHSGGLGGHFDIDWSNRNALVKQLSTAMVAAVEGGKLRGFSSCSILTVARADEPIFLPAKRFSTLFESRVLSSQSCPLKRPFYLAGKSDYARWCVLRDFNYNAGQNKAVIREEDIAIHAEGNAWLTIEYCRLPASYLAAKPRFEHLTTESLGSKLICQNQVSDAPDAAPYRYLSKFEAHFGRQLLHAMKSTDLNDFDLVEREDVPS